MDRLEELEKAIQELDEIHEKRKNDYQWGFINDRYQKLKRESEDLIKKIETRIQNEKKIMALIEPIIRDVDFDDQDLFGQMVYYDLLPYPWEADQGKIRDKHGQVIGTYTQDSSGRLMAKGPELIELLSLTLLTIGDVLRSEPDLSNGNREVLEEISNMLRDAIQDKNQKD